MTNPERPAPDRSKLLRLAELPAQIESVERPMNGMKSDKIKAERKQKAIEARHRLAVSALHKNEKDRDAALLLMCENDTDWIAATERIAELDGIIRAHRAQYDLLRREKDTLQAIVIAQASAAWKEVLQDEKFVEIIGGRLLA